MKRLILGFSAIALLSGALRAQVVEAPQPPEPPRVDGNVRVNIPRPPRPMQDMQVPDGPTRSKTFSKSFILDNSDKINLYNVHGSMVIKSWDKKEIKVDIDIKGYSNTEEEAQKLIDEVRIDAGKAGDIVTFKTVLNENGKYGMSLTNGKVKWRRQLKVNYIVYMPATNALTASQQYGNMEIGSFAAPTSLKVQYGNLVANSLASANNYLSAQYGDIKVTELNKGNVKQQYGNTLTIGTVNTLDLNIQYAAANIGTIKGNAVIKAQYGGGVTIGSVDNLDLDAQYAKVKVTTLNGNISAKQQYGNLNLVSVTGKANVIAQYTGITIGTLKGDGNFNVEYDRLTINEVGVACKNLIIKSEYVNITLGFASGYNANADINTDYAGFRPGSYTSIKQVRENDRDYSSKKYYEGKINNGGPGILRIDAEYGGVTLK
ncbi:MAG: hypothetical protein EOO89_03650 [Pedobacter sp.]|nr:MAG: hypothetical protein EOO89_03650 [Pedobacter sp.]